METDKVSRPGGEHGEGEPDSPIAFYLDPASGAPVYRQLVQQVERALLLGYLREGDRLPRIREVTATLAVNPDTVQKAYRELETRGVAEGRDALGIEAIIDHLLVEAAGVLFARDPLLGDGECDRAVLEQTGAHVMVVGVQAEDVSMLLRHGLF